MTMCYLLPKQMIDALVAAAGPLPTEYADRKQTLLCNDCEVGLSCILHHDDVPELLRFRQLPPLVAFACA